MIPEHVSGTTKVIGYFSYAQGNVFCDGDACIIAGSEEGMKSYLQRISQGNKPDRIRKTRFGEIIEGLRGGGAYAFDEESYSRFLPLARINGIDSLPDMEYFLDKPSDTLQFIRIQIAC